MSARLANCIQPSQNSSDSPHIQSGGRHMAFPMMIHGHGFFHAVLPSTQDFKITLVSSSRQMGEWGRISLAPQGQYNLHYIPFMSEDYMFSHRCYSDWEINSTVFSGG